MFLEWVRILPCEHWWVMMQLVWDLVDPGAAGLGSCGVLAVTDSVRTLPHMAIQFPSDLSLYDSLHPRSQQTCPGQAGKDVQFPQQEHQELLSGPRLPVCLCWVECVLHLCL